jgi:hypothetical protein
MGWLTRATRPPTFPRIPPNLETKNVISVMARAMLYILADQDGAAAMNSAEVTGEITMLRVRSFIGFALVAMTSVFATGCIAESSEPEQLVWYDDDLDACFTQNTKGQTVQVPCEESAGPGMNELYTNGTACTGSTCCDARTVNDEGFCD